MTVNDRQEHDFRGHPRESETFWFSETTTGPNSFRRVIRSYVAFDSRWPWWRRAWATLMDPTR